MPLNTSRQGRSWGNYESSLRLTPTGATNILVSPRTSCSKNDRVSTISGLNTWRQSDTRSRYYGSDASTPVAAGIKRSRATDRTSQASGYSRDARYGPGGLLHHKRVTHQRKQVSKESFKLGTIVRSLHAEEAYNGGTHLSENNKAKAYDGTEICIKERKMIVVGRYASNYLAIPLYSFMGRGTETKTAKLEYISVRDHRGAQDRGFKAQSPYEPLVTEELADDIKFYEPTTVAWLTFPLPRDYNTSVVIEGCLDYGSTRRLIELVRSYSASKLPQLDDGEIPHDGNLLRNTNVEPSELRAKEKSTVKKYLEGERQRDQRQTSARSRY